MSGSQPEFIGHVSKSVAGLLGTILREEGMQLFRRHPQVLLGSSEATATNDYILNFTVNTTSDNDKGSFSCKISQDRFLVFRSPSRLTLNFTLVAKDLPGSQLVRSYDKLVGYFFDHRAIDPFVPEALKKFGPLYEKLMSGKAELRVNEVGQIPSANHSETENFHFSFSYLALYHSGNPLREESKAKTRVIDLVNENERNVL